MKLLFATGGTGGHINPALAVAGKIREEYGDEVEILFVGTPTHMETRLVPQAGFDFTAIDVRGFYRGLSWNNIKRDSAALVKMFTSSVQAKKLIKEYQPDAAIGFGGYVSGPVIRAAAKLGVPTAIHEQNAYPGITNKALAKMVDVVMLTSEDAEKRIECKNPPVITGLPVRGEMVSADRAECRKKLGIPDDRILVLSMGGSLGADAINHAMCELIAKEKDNKKLYFIHAYGQYGQYVPEELKSLGVDAAHYGNITLREYIDDMEVCMPAADIVSPNVAENHQYYNAMELVDRDAALIIEQKDLTGDTLYEATESLVNDPEKIRTIEANARAMAILDATERIAGNLMDLAKAHAGEEDNG